MVAKRISAPERGDLVWLNFDPVRGHEQQGRRPALVVSPKSYNSNSELALVCPITSQVKEYPFEVVFESKKVRGSILADHLRSIDWKERRAERIGTVSEAVLSEVQHCIEKLVL